MTVAFGRLRFVPANSRLTMGIDELLPLGVNKHTPGREASALPSWTKSARKPAAGADDCVSSYASASWKPVESAASRRLRKRKP